MTCSSAQAFCSAPQHPTAPYLAQRARIVLRAAKGGPNAAMPTSWGWMWEDLSARERLEDLPRSGRPAEITAEQVIKIVALACEAPQTSGRPISQWTGAEIAEEVMRRGIVEQISPRHARRLLLIGA
jgi:hypothetical protein